ncbi:hypothetical protein FAD_0479 [Ferroplasma acidiphilum]|uniref:Uncharacterized protein n=1 Tax=Ferroplasma acidiphilum TaxID=74969 RepID=A0A1V0N2R4_9ARCH|nr:hypothetical protein FAD_0479 [Ferroplasma acidiphilum]
MRIVFNPVREGFLAFFYCAADSYYITALFTYYAAYGRFIQLIAHINTEIFSSIFPLNFIIVIQVSVHSFGF